MAVINTESHSSFHELCRKFLRRKWMDYDGVSSRQFWFLTSRCSEDASINAVMKKLKMARFTSYEKPEHFRDVVGIRRYYFLDINLFPLLLSFVARFLCQVLHLPWLSVRICRS